ncbi:hypothetical protein [Cohnella caldifontis]|uniref:hypothetical protein n=1 Tax=Cohnella caldifontis TaxID=3027471 RepID=UPI0023ED1A60|nr:hypothetical protein [Cohnella sp. YIM B05605]
MNKFEEAWETFLACQKAEATGMRREMLDRDLTGTKKLCEALWRVFGTFEDLELEHELVSETGVKIYVDVYHRKLGIAFEAEGYVVHAEKITRERHSFERMRVRSIAKLNLKYMPFSWDELDKKPEACVRSVYEALGIWGSGRGDKWMELSVYERELIRCGLAHTGTFSMTEACEWLQLAPFSTRKAVRGLVDKHLLILEGGGPRRFHKLRVSPEAVRLLQGR